MEGGSLLTSWDPIRKGRGVGVQPNFSNFSFLPTRDSLRHTCTGHVSVVVLNPGRIQCTVAIVFSFLFQNAT